MRIMLEKSDRRVPEPASPIAPDCRGTNFYEIDAGLNEFGLMCPISVTDTSIHLIRKFGGEDLKTLLLPRMLAADPAQLWKGTQFITEQAGGSDVGAIETIARREDQAWRLFGDKWFCSHADADVALLLARP